VEAVQMSKEILLVVDAVSHEKGVEKDIIFQAIESALATATRKRHGEDIDVRVEIDRDSGDYETFRRWLVVDDEDPEFETPVRQKLLTESKTINPSIEPGDYIEEQIESVAFGRIAAQTAKQVIFKRYVKPSVPRWSRLLKTRKGSWSAAWSSAWKRAMSMLTWAITQKLSS
jgi:N utilization substance protein A